MKPHGGAVFWMCAALAGTSVQVSWDKMGRSLTAVPPEGTEIAPDAPVDLEVTVGNRTLSAAGDGRWLAQGIALGGMTGVIRGTLDLQLCEKETGVCAPETLHIEGSLPSSKKGRVSLSIQTPAEKPAEKIFNEDVSNPVAYAFAKAQAEGTQVLLDFSAIWCPPCNALAAEVLHAEDAEVLLEGFEVVVVDVDHPSSWPLKSKYGIGGYPTVVVTDAEGAALETIEGYPGKAAFLERLAHVGSTSPFQEKRDAFREAPTGEGLAALVSERPDQLVELLMENEAWSTGEGAESVRALLPRVLPSLPSTVAADALWFRAKHLEEEGQRAATYATAAALLKAGFRGGAEDRAYFTFYSHLLADAGDLDGAVAFLDEHSRANPDDPTFLLSAALTLNEHERYEDALRRADMAAARSWGDILLRVEKAACDALVGLERADEAKARAEKALAAQEAPAEEVKVRAHKYRERLQAFL